MERLASLRARKSMLILHIITDLSTGGAELMLERLVMHQSREGRYRHHVISLRTLGQVGPRLQAAGIEVEVMGMNGVAGLALGFVRLVRRIRRLAPDVVQTWMYHADLLGGIAARLAGNRRILWGVRIMDISPAIGIARSTMLSRRFCIPLSSWVPRRILYVAEAARKVHEALGYDPEKSVVVPNGYSLPPPDAVAASRRRMREELGLAEDALLIGSAGRFSPQKNYRGFVAAAGEIARRFPQARFLILGREITWENDELAGWIREAGIADRFHLVGEQRNVLDWLAALDIFALYSLSEGFPNVVAEAMSVCVPCIVTDVGDAALLVEDSGILIRSGDLNGLTEGLERLISAGEDERRRLGEAGRRRVEATYSLSVVAERYARLYDELAGEGPAPAADARQQEIGA
jgi:glycosyltransferase involved in cell wall biosynthesis